MGNMRREAKDINCSPHQDGFMAASSTLPLILLGFPNLRHPRTIIFVVMQKDMNAVMDRNPNVVAHSTPGAKVRVKHLSSSSPAAAHQQM